MPAPELRDLRAKVTADTDQVLDAISRATGKDKSEIVREVLSAWASEEVHKATMVLRLIDRKGNAEAASPCE
jgi:predicted DNA-binding protein